MKQIFHLKSVRPFLVTLICLFSTLVIQTSTAYAQNEEGSVDIASSESEIPNDEIESNEEIEPNNQVLFKQMVPYMQFVNYHYLGNGSNFSTKDIIMEYTPDGNGIFQVAEFVGDQARAFIYQTRDSGLYELAFFENYHEVQDLRYSADASDGVDSLILPSNIEVGLTYQSGYQNEITSVIKDIYPLVTIGSNSYENVLLIEEYSNLNGENITKHIYVAPMYGVIQVEQIQSDGTLIPLMQLSRTEGYIGE